MPVLSRTLVVLYVHELLGNSIDFSSSRQQQKLMSRHSIERRYLLADDDDDLSIRLMWARGSCILRHTFAFSLRSYHATHLALSTSFCRAYLRALTHGSFICVSMRIRQKWKFISQETKLVRAPYYTDAVYTYISVLLLLLETARFTRGATERKWRLFLW